MKNFFVLLFCLATSNLFAQKITITIDSRKKAETVTPNLFGNNATTYTGIYSADSLLIKYCKSLDMGVVRYPGGDASNVFFYDGIPSDIPSEVLTYNSSWDGFLSGRDTTNWRMNLEQYYSFLSKIGAAGMITVNYPYARYSLSEDRLRKAASLAAGWVRRDNGRTKLWEVGNESYACWEGGFKVDTAVNSGVAQYISGTSYGKDFKVIADSMRQAAKNKGYEILVGAVMTDNDGIWDGSGKNITKNWNKELVRELKRNDGGSYADFISIHSYFLDPSDTTAKAIILSARKIDTMSSYIGQFFKDQDMIPLPLALSEWNINGENGGRQGSHASGLQAVYSILKMVKSNYIAACRFAIKDYWRGSENKGDFGLFSNGNPDVEDSTPYSPYYHLYYLRKTLSDNLLEISSTNNDNLYCAASKHADGTIGIVCINISENITSLDIKIKGQRVKTANSYLIESADSNDPMCNSITINNKQPYPDCLPTKINLSNINLPPFAVMYITTK